MSNEQIMEMGTDELWDAYSSAKKSHDRVTERLVEAEMRARYMLPED